MCLDNPSMNMPIRSKCAGITSVMAARVETSKGTVMLGVSINGLTSFFLGSLSDPKTDNICLNMLSEYSHSFAVLPMFIVAIALAISTSRSISSI